MDFNPNADTILGPEILPRVAVTGNIYRALRSPADSLMETIQSTVAETVTNMSKWFRVAVPTPGGGATLVEVVNAGQEKPTNVLTTTFQPSRGESLNVEKASDGSVDVNAWQGVVTGTDQVFNATDAIATIGIGFNTGGALTGKRILAVRFVILVEATAVAGSGPGILQVAVGAMGGSVVPALGSDFYPSSSFDSLTVDLGEVCPNTGLPFTYIDVQDYAASFPHLVLTLNAGNTNQLVIVSKVTMEVDYCDENRLCADIVSTGTGGYGLRAWTPHKPDGTANLAKPATDITVISRQPRYGTVPLSFSVQADALIIPCMLDLPAGMPDVILDSTLAPTGAVTTVGTPDRRMFTETDMIVAGAISIDAQPYGYVSTNPWTVAQQEFTPFLNATYAGLRLLTAYVPLADGTIADLTVNLRRRSDSSLIRTATVTQALADSFAPDPLYAGYRVIHVEWAPVLLTSAVQYYVELVFGGAAPSSWTLPILVAGNTGIGGMATWHNVADEATRDTDLSYMDYPWLLVPATPTPTGLVAAPGIYDTGPIEDAAGFCEYPIDELLALGDDRHETLRVGGEFDALLLRTITGYVPNDPAGCLVAGLAYMAVSWTPTGLFHTLFGYYELQRMDDDDDWATIDYEITDAAASYDDIEARRGVQSCYRVRVVTSYGIMGAWSAVGCATALTGGNGLTFTSNFYPALGVAATDVVDAGSAAERVYTSPEATEGVVQHLAGRDNAVVLSPLERRGEAFTRSVLINALRIPPIPWVHAFDALRYLAKAAAVPYVCVRDENGDRWFAAITVPDFKIRQPREFYFATITVLTVQGVPTPTGTLP